MGEQWERDRNQSRRNRTGEVRLVTQIVLAGADVRKVLIGLKTGRVLTDLEA